MEASHLNGLAVLEGDLERKRLIPPLRRTAEKWLRVPAAVTISQAQGRTWLIVGRTWEPQPGSGCLSPRWSRGWAMGGTH